LTDFEATRKHRKTREFLDLCGVCATHLPKFMVNEDDLMVMQIERDTINTDYDDIEDTSINELSYYLDNNK
jgi:hypothetical protein